MLQRPPPAETAHAVSAAGLCSIGTATVTTIGRWREQRRAATLWKENDGVTRAARGHRRR